ncbi:hypothetical protein M5K25_025766 [Dendrobium thyrsiflorum]|uniref:Uncharacterized protein n=1 Tax=Dendrobium thyrsiflorum TaxID=117978 RepID=A0ABD0UA89_DENTH
MADRAGEKKALRIRKLVRMENYHCIIDRSCMLVSRSRWMHVEKRGGELKIWGVEKRGVDGLKRVGRRLCEGKEGLGLGKGVMVDLNFGIQNSNNGGSCRRFGLVGQVVEVAELGEVGGRREGGGQAAGWGREGVTADGIGLQGRSDGCWGGWARWGGRSAYGQGARGRMDKGQGGVWTRGKGRRVEIFASKLFSSPSRIPPPSPLPPAPLLPLSKAHGPPPTLFPSSRPRPPPPLPYPSPLPPSSFSPLPKPPPLLPVLPHHHDGLCMGDPASDHGFLYDEQGRVDILNSPFFDVSFGNDRTADEYMDRVIYQLTLALEDRLPRGPWYIVSNPLTSPNPTSSPATYTLRVTTPELDPKLLQQLLMPLWLLSIPQILADLIPGQLQPCTFQAGLQIHRLAGDFEHEMGELSKLVCNNGGFQKSNIPLRKYENINYLNHNCKWFDTRSSKFWYILSTALLINKRMRFRRKHSRMSESCTCTDGALPQVTRTNLALSLSPCCKMDCTSFSTNPQRSSSKQKSDELIIAFPLKFILY